MEVRRVVVATLASRLVLRALSRKKYHGMIEVPIATCATHSIANYFFLLRVSTPSKIYLFVTIYLQLHRTSRHLRRIGKEILIFIENCSHTTSCGLILRGYFWSWRGRERDATGRRRRREAGLGGGQVGGRLNRV